MPVSPYTRERLAEVAGSSTTLSEALVKLGVDPESTTRRYIHERMKSMDIDTSHFVSQRRTDAMKDNRRRRSPEELLVEMAPAHARRVPSERLKRAMLTLGVIERCVLCGTGPRWRGGRLPLEVDHI
ncbi:hypothetical protein ACFRNT_08365 [Streptomyces sp. NPDC056697]|uniref:hypothetical protein n=1 Tax=Streptomyces sp. NPDC056697 TaxID=3345915 RepID=UPI0036B05E9A